jgi:GntR family transcriptional regulator
VASPQATPPGHMTAPQIVTERIHLQLTRLCRSEIVRGAYRPEERFPSEREIAQRFGVSRATANKVISNMVAEGTLVLRPGIGTFVATGRGLQTSLRQMESFTDNAFSAGMVPETKVLCFRKNPCLELPESIRETLQAGRKASIWYFERLRFASGEPVILEHRWVRSDLVPGLKANQLRGSFYHYLEENHQIYLTGERHKIRAKNLSAEEARKFELEDGAAVLVVEGTGFTDADVPVWYQVLYYRGDRYELENQVETFGGKTKLSVQRRS